jgi:hypothetical protein
MKIRAWKYILDLFRGVGKVRRVELFDGKHGDHSQSGTCSSNDHAQLVEREAADEILLGIYGVLAFGNWSWWWSFSLL